MKKKASRRTDPRVARILRLLDRNYPQARCALLHENPFQLLVSTILSAQCTDARVNMVTPGLFARYPTPQALSKARTEDLEEQIRSTGFFRSKSRSLLGASRAIVGDFGGRVPQSMEELLTLPGVARKTANVVLGTGFGIAVGVVVDTHVGRIAQRLGLTRHQDPKKIEQDLMRILPRKAWIDFSHQIIHHGRQVCMARKPQCGRCSLLDVCRYPPRFEIAAGAALGAGAKVSRHAPA